MLEDLKQRVIMFIGAGASKPFGIPDMKDFVAKLDEGIMKNEYKDLWNFWYFVKDTIPPQSREKDLEWVLDFLNMLTSPDLVFYTQTIERLISKVLSQKDLRIGGSDIRPQVCSVLQAFREDARSQIESKSKKLSDIIKKYIRYKCMEFELDVAVEKYSQALNSLYKVIGDELWVFTTNYDLIIESYYENKDVQKEVKLCCGFEIQENAPREIWRPGLLTMKRYDIFRLLRIGSKKLLRLFKLHGSCDWFKTEQGIFRLGMAGDPILPGGRKPENILIYPGTKQEFYEQPFRELFSSFQRALFESNGCIVIGFSFRDKHITPLFRERLARKDNFKLAIVDPQAEKTVRNHFSEYRNRVILIPFKFGQDDWKAIYLRLIEFFNNLTR